MEAEVLNPPALMADVNGNNKVGAAELEVLKLQELVRQLERENERLRTRANAVNNRSQLQTSLSSLLGPPAERLSPECDAPSPTRLDPRVPDEPIAYFQPSSGSPDAEAEDSGAGGGATTVLDEVDVLDLDTLLPFRDPETWLYVNPRAKPRGQSALSTLQWRRQVLDNPGPELKLAKLKFLHRLDQAKWWRGVSPIRPYSCTEGLSTLSSPVLPYTKPAALSETPAPLPSPGPSFLQSPAPLRAGGSLADRAPTFLSNSTPHNVGRRQATVTPQSSVDSEVGVSELEYDSISMGYKLEDMTDVVVMARLQEESLREDCASTSATPSRRSSSFSLHSLRRSEMDLEEEDEEEDDDEGYDQLPPPQPRLFRGKSMQRASLPHSHTFSSIRDCRRSSTTSQFSLSGLPQYSAPSSLITEAHAAYRNGSDKLRRSMPNLIRAPSMPSVPSMPCLASPVNPPSYGPSSLPVMPSLRSSQSFDSSNGLARLQSSIPFPGQLSQRVQSVGNFATATRRPLKATAYVNPTVQQNPTASPLTASVSLHSVPGSAAGSQPLQPGGSLLPQSLKASTGQSAIARGSLSRPASFVGTNGIPRPSGITQPTRSLLTPPKSLAAMSALRDSSWKDGCF